MDYPLSHKAKKFLTRFLTRVNCQNPIRAWDFLCPVLVCSSLSICHSGLTSRRCAAVFCGAPHFVLAACKPRERREATEQIEVKKEVDNGNCFLSCFFQSGYPAAAPDPARMRSAELQTRVHVL